MESPGDQHALHTELKPQEYCQHPALRGIHRPRSHHGATSACLHMGDFPPPQNPIRFPSLPNPSINFFFFI